MSAISNRVRKVVAEQFGIDADQIDGASRIVADLGADDVDEIEVVIGLEDEFGIEISDEAMQTLVTVQQYIDHITAKLANRI